MIILLIISLCLLSQPLIAESPTILNSHYLTIIQRNSLNWYLATQKNETLVYEQVSRVKWVYLEWIKEKYPELHKIIECESGFKENVCNAEFGCYAGQGLAQIIPNTLKHCEKQLGRSLDVFNSVDNLDCAVYLYTKEGNFHWNSSLACWSK